MEILTRWWQLNFKRFANQLVRRKSDRFAHRQSTVKGQSYGFESFRKLHRLQQIGHSDHRGFATTFSDLSRHKVFDVTLGRSELSLRSYLKKLIGKERVRVVVMDLSETYRSIAKKYFSNALIVADRFHVMRLVNQQFVRTWAELDEIGRKHRGLVSLMRRKPDRIRPEQRIRALVG